MPGSIKPKLKPKVRTPETCKPAKKSQGKRVQVTRLEVERPKSGSGTPLRQRSSTFSFFGPENSTTLYRFQDGIDHPASSEILNRRAAILPRSIGRLGSRYHAGYPLTRDHRVVLTRERAGVVAELAGYSKDLGIRGIGLDEEAALRDLERLFERLVLEKVRIPPHARQAEDDRIRLIVNQLVDWEQYELENPAPRLILGRILRKAGTPNPTVRWFLGPRGERNQTARIPPRLMSSYFVGFDEGDWFRGVILDYSNRVEWIEPPARCPDPTDPREQENAWRNIPVVQAKEVDVWPLKQG